MAGSTSYIAYPHVDKDNGEAEGSADSASTVRMAVAAMGPSASSSGGAKPSKKRKRKHQPGTSAFHVMGSGYDKPRAEARVASAASVEDDTYERSDSNVEHQVMHFLGREVGSGKSAEEWSDFTGDRQRHDELNGDDVESRTKLADLDPVDPELAVLDSTAVATSPVVGASADMAPDGLQLSSSKGSAEQGEKDPSGLFLSQTNRGSARRFSLVDHPDPDPNTGVITMTSNLKYVENPASAKRRKKLMGEVDEVLKRSSWRGDGSEKSGTFKPDEVAELDRFMEEYCKENRLTLGELCERVWSVERKRDSFWDGISSVLPNRTRASIYKHVRRQYHVFHQRGKWTKEEDEELGSLVAEKGSQWKRIGLLLHRMPEDCRDRWRNYVKCGDMRAQNKWDEIEESQLQEIVLDMWNNDSSQINWTVVSERMGGRRSRIQCRYKWNKLRKRSHTFEQMVFGALQQNPS